METYIFSGRTFDIGFLKALIAYLKQKNKINYFVSGKNNEGRGWVRIPYDAYFTKSLGADNFSLTLIRGEIQDTTTSTSFELTPKQNGSSNIELKINGEDEVKKDLTEKIKHFFDQKNL